MIASARPAARIDSRIGTRRKHPAVAEAALVAHQQEIDVATHAQMLKAVVENHRVERAELAQQLDAIKAPPRNRDRTAERLRHHGRFVARILQRDFQHASVSHQLGGLFRSRPSVAAAHDSDAEAVALQAPREKQCERRLAGSTDRQIADAHCQHRSPAFHHPPVQQARAHADSVEARSGRQSDPRRKQAKRKIPIPQSFDSRTARTRLAGGHRSAETNERFEMLQGDLRAAGSSTD